MGFSITSLPYLVSLASACFLAYRFFQYWKVGKTVLSKFFFYFVAIFSLFLSVTTFATMFFGKNIPLLKGAVIVTAFLEGVGAAFLGYILVYVLLPRISPWVGFSIPILLGTTAAVLSALTPFDIFIEPSGLINWGYRPIADTLRNAVYLLTFFPMIIYLFVQYRKADNFYVKQRALGLEALFIFVMIIILLDYGLEIILSLPTYINEMVQVVLGIFLFIFLFLTQKSPSDIDKGLPPGYTKIVR